MTGSRGIARRARTDDATLFGVPGTVGMDTCLVQARSFEFRWKIASAEEALSFRPCFSSLRPLLRLQREGR